MLSSMRDIISVALREHDNIDEIPSDLAAYTSSLIAAINDSAQLPSYSSSSEPLTLVSFSCMLQDTGYPMEVYLPERTGPGDEPPDLSQLQERWVGWGVEVPGQQPWVLPVKPSDHRGPAWDPALQSKFPLKENQAYYLGALIKIYDEAAYKPASRLQISGILSTSFLPSGDSDALTPVPTIHALAVNTSPHPKAAVDPAIRSALIDHFASLFEPRDPIAAELLLLSLISAPISRQSGQEVLGTLSVNFISSKSTETSRTLIKAIESVSPYVVTLPLSIDSLHQESFLPRSADSTSLDSGVLQLSEGTVLAIQEGEMGSGGQLEECAVNNLQALMDCLRTQTLRYVYPYMDNLRMDCAIRGIVFSEGKSLIPVDLHVPLIGHAKSSSVTSEHIVAYRSYLEERARAGARVQVPDDVAHLIQEEFVHGRQRSEKSDAEVAVTSLKRRMRIARLLAQSHADHQLTPDIWRHACVLDEETSHRLAGRQTS